MRQCNWINQVGIRCGQPYSHSGQHGNGLMTTRRDIWRQMMCIWSGAHGTCLLEFQHDGPHKEGKTSAQ